MHFDPRTQQALREAGLDTDEIREVSDRVADLVADDADAIATFFDADGPFYSDMELAHSTSEIQEHETADADLFTHGADLRGYLSFESWGVPVEGGRVLSEAVVELKLGATVHDRVRFARDPDEL